jgi:hypothetical protein
MPTGRLEETFDPPRGHLTVHGMCNRNAALMTQLAFILEKIVDGVAMQILVLFLV